ncbi:MAG: alpha-glucosidase [Lachnospiraceae bacterium]|nr:alpha-glucosidase [Lachnospiraceae bacterium]
MKLSDIIRSCRVSLRGRELPYLPGRWLHPADGSVQEAEGGYDLVFVFEEKPGTSLRLQIREWGDGITAVDMAEGLPEGFERVAIYLKVPGNEHLYGCGQSSESLDLKGKKLEIHPSGIRVRRKGSGEDLRRQAVNWAAGRFPEPFGGRLDTEFVYTQPTFISSEKYFVHAEAEGGLTFDFRKKGETILAFGEPLRLRFGEARDFPALSARMTNLLGYQCELPDWVFDGAILKLQGGTELVEKRLMEAQEAGCAVSGVWLPDWCGCRRSDTGYRPAWNWEADPVLYHDLKARIKFWRRKKVRFIGYINPYLAEGRSLYEEASAQGYLLRNKKGEVYRFRFDSFAAGRVDFTNPDACEWFKGIIKENMIGIGLGGWMADYAEGLPEDAVLMSGETPESFNRRWPALWARINREAVCEGEKDGVVFFFTGAGNIEEIAAADLIWSGRRRADWSREEGLSSVIPAALSLAMSGFPIVHSHAGGQIGPGGGHRGRQLLMRWMEMNVFSPLLLLEDENDPGEGARFDTDPALLAHTALCAKLHVLLKPYLKRCLREAAFGGLPVMRPLFYHYEEEYAFGEENEYLLGRDILVAPLLEKGEMRRRVLLPEDLWIHLFTGKVYEGPSRGYVRAKPGCPPVFVRAGSGLDYLVKRVMRTVGNKN